MYSIVDLEATGGKFNEESIIEIAIYKFDGNKIIDQFISLINPKKEIVIGFGITDKTIGKLKSADGLVVGSAICKEITRSLISRQNPVTNVGKLVRKLKNKIK